MKQTGKRLLSVVLALALTAGLLPVLPALVTEAAAAETSSATNGFGFDTSVPGDFDANDGENPYGSGQVSLNPLMELYADASSVASVGVYDATDVTFDDYFGYPEETAKETTLSKVNSGYLYVETVAFDPTDTGKDDHVAYVGLRAATYTYQTTYNQVTANTACLDVWVVDARTGAQVGSTLTFGYPGQSDPSRTDSYNCTGAELAWIREDGLTNADYAGWLTIAAGDVDDDGKDELFAYYPANDTEGPRVLRIDTKSGTATTVTKAWSKWKTIEVNGDYYTPADYAVNIYSPCAQKYNIMPKVDLAVGDPDKDNVDELAVAVGWDANASDFSDWWGSMKSLEECLGIQYGKGTVEGGDIVTGVQVYEFTTADACELKTAFSIVNPDNYVWVPDPAVPTVTFGDPDGDYREELLFTTTGTSGFYVLDISVSGEDKIWTYSSTFYEFNGFKTYYSWYTSQTSGTAPKALACFAYMGFNSRDAVFYNGYAVTLAADARVERVFYYYDNCGFKVGTDPTAYGLYTGTLENRWYSAVTVGNFNGNTAGAEQVLFVMNRTVSTQKNYFSAKTYTNWADVGVCQYVTSTYDNGTRTYPYGYLLDAYSTYYDYDEDVFTNVPGWAMDYWTKTVRGANSYVTLAAVDVDNDTTYLQYRSKEYTFDSPKLIAILQAAPYFQDLGDYYYDAVGGTSFGLGKSSGSGLSESVTTSTAATVKVGASVPLINLEVYVQATASSEWSEEYSFTQTTTTEISFGGGRMENNVVLLGTPVTVYTYDAYEPDGSGGYKKGEMSVVVPGAPQYSIITVDQYNEAAAVGGYAQISDSQVHAEPGRPATYYQDGSGELKGLTKLVTYGGEFSGVTGSASASTTRTIANETEYEITRSQSFSMEIEAGMEVAGSGFSASFGVGGGSGETTVNTSGVTRECEVANVPSEGNGKYSFLWNMAIWETRVGSQSVPVVGYILKNVNQPPSLPDGFTVTSTTANSVTLGWDPDSTDATTFEIYQYFASSDTYTRLVSLPGNATEYTVTGLGSGKSYQYIICSLDAAGQRSVNSAPITAVTLPEGGACPTIKTQPQNTSVTPGSDASFLVIATPATGSNTGLTYTWYENKEGSSLWNAVGDNAYILELSDVNTGMDGNRYRCVITQTIQGEQVMVYSEIAELKVGRGDTETGLTLSQNTGSADYSVKGTTTETIDVPKSIQVTVGSENEAVTAPYVEFSATGLSGDTIYQASNGDYYVLEGLTVGENGAYTATSAIPLTADSRYFKDGSTNLDYGPDDLRGTERAVFTFEADENTAVDYYVYAANRTTTTTIPVEGEDGGSAETTVDVTQTEYLTVYALKSEVDDAEEENDITYYMLEEITTAENENQAATITYEMTQVTPDEGTVAPVYAAGTLIVKDSSNTVVDSIPDPEEEEESYTTYQVLTPDADPLNAVNTVYLVGDDCYLLTLTADEETRTTTVTEKKQLTVVDPAGTYSGGSYSNVTPGEPVTVQKTVYSTSYTPKPGAPVTLTATVNGGTGNPVTGTVTFKIVNISTGVSKNYSASVSGTGTALLTWTPSGAGVYEITASYSGSGLLLSSTSAAVTYYATDGLSAPVDPYVLRAKDTVAYGDTISLRLYTTSTNDSTTTETAYSGTGASYQVKYKDAADSSADSDGIVTVNLAGATSWTAPKPGTYTFVATVGTGENAPTATRAVTVTKRGLTVSVGAQAENEDIPGTGDLVFTGLLEGESDFKALFSITPELTESSPSGTYTVTPAVKSIDDDDAETKALLADFNEKYDWTPQSGIWTVTGEAAHTVTLNEVYNGSMIGYVGNSMVPITGTVGAVADGDSLYVEATPDKGFHVNEWTVTGTDAYTESADKTYLLFSSVTQDLTIGVTFAVNTFSVSYSAGEGGTVTVQNGEGQALSGATIPVLQTDTLVFTAVPAEGYVVDRWTINDVEQKNADGTPLSANTLSLTDFDQLANEETKALAVKVTFAEVTPLTVSYATVDTAGNPKPGASVTVTETKPDGTTRTLTADDMTVTKGSQLTFTATPVSGTMVAAWKNADGTTLSGSSKTFTISSVQADVDLKIVLSGGDSVTGTLNFSVVRDTTGEAITADNCKLTAISGSASLTSGNKYSVYIPVDFQLTVDPDLYEVVKWTVNGADLEDSADLQTYSLPNGLQGDTTVQVTVKKTKLQVTIPESSDNGTVTVTADGTALTGSTTVPCGANITVALSPSKGYEVSSPDPSWTAVANSDNYTYTVANAADDLTVAVTWAAIPQYSVTYSVVDANGEEEGGTNGALTASVDRKSMGIYAVNSFPGTTDENSKVYRDSTVTFTAAPASGYRVKEWKVNDAVQTKDGITDISNTLTLSVSEVKTVSVEFVAVGSTVTVTAGENGTIASAMVGETDYLNSISSGFSLENDASVVIAAAPDTGYEVASWSVNGTVVPDETDNTYTYSGSGAAITVSFQPAAHTVSWSGDTNGTVSAAGYTGASASIRGGVSVTFTAAPNAGYVVDHWTVNNVTVENENDSTLTWTVPADTAADTAYAVAAVFKPGTYTVTVTPPDNCTITTSPAVSGGVQGGTEVTFTAEPDTGYIVTGWTVNGTTTNTRETSWTVTITEDTTVTVLVAPYIEYNITFNANGGTVTPESAATTDGKLTSLPTPIRSGYTFDGWFTAESGGTQVTANTVFTADATVYAHWTATATPPTGGGSSGGSGSGGFGSGGSSSGSDTDAGETTLPVTTGNKTEGGTVATETTAAPAADVQDGTASAAISDAIGGEIIAQAVENNSSAVVIAPAITEDVSRTEVTLPASTVESIAAQTAADLTISTPVADVTIPNGGLADLAYASETVTVTAEKTDGTVELTITADGKTVDTIPGGVTLTVAYDDCAPGTVAVLIKDDGTREVVRKSVAGSDSVSIPLDGSARLEIVDNSKQFDDVSSTDWAADAVAFTSGHELFNGTSESTFSPELNMTRGMLSVVLHNLENNPAHSITGEFPDVGSTWYTEAVGWAADRGIVTGYPDGTFGAEESITREQLAVMLWRYAGSPDSSHSLDSFTDGDQIGGYALEALKWANENGVINGYGNGVLDPQGQATRAEVAQMLKNFMENIN